MDSEIVLNLPQDIHKICRTCMTVTDNNMLCHDVTLFDINNLTVAGEMLQFCLSTKHIRADDGLPKTICKDCAAKLEIVYNFKYQCEKNEETFRVILNEPFQEKDVSQGVILYENILGSSYINEDNRIKVENSDIDIGLLFNNELVNCNLGIGEANESDLSSQSEILKMIEDRKQVIDNNEDDSSNEYLFLMENQDNSSLHDEFSFVACKVEVLDDDEFKTHNFEESFDLDIKTEVQETFEDLETLYACYECNQYFKTEEAHTEHMLNHNQILDLEYSCDLCNRVFGTEARLLTHFYKHARDLSFDDLETLNFYECSVCSARFANSSEYRTHVDEHANTDLVTCEICDELFTGMMNLMDHLKEHHVFVAMCKYCLKRFNSAVMLKGHMKKHWIELKNTNFKCPICKAEYEKIAELKAHCLLHRDDTFLCTRCKRSFTNKLSFEAHERDHMEPRYLCALCGKQFFTQTTLASHSRQHNNEKPFQCLHCKKFFRSRGSLTIHERIHTEFKPYVCSYCGYSCRQSGDLAMHIRTHTGVKPYKCSFPSCDKEFTTSSQRMEHHRRHTNERKHICSVCGKAFLESKTLKVHMMTHTGERPHKCEHCGKKFRRTHHLTVHKRAHSNYLRTD